MPTQLTTETATITTAAIQIQTLTIGKKQVTLAVFRQLREEPLIAEDGTLNGVPWGIVNYHPDKCADAKEHLHVVWQRGDELRRSHVRAPEHAYHDNRTAGAFVLASVANGLTRADNPTGIKLYDGTLAGSGTPWALVEWNGVQFRHRISKDCCIAFLEYGPAADHRRERLRDWVVATAHGVDLDDLPGKFADHLYSIADAYKASWRALAQLPQLFIAV